MGKKFSIFDFQFSISGGFTLIEMLVTIAIIAIVSGVVIVGINPAKRIQDAQDSRARQDVRSVASAVEACLSWVDPTSGVTNQAAACGASSGGVNTSLSAAPPAPCVPSASQVCGGSFARVVPSAVKFSAVVGATVRICELGSPGAIWEYSTTTGQVAEAAGGATCP